MDRRRFIKAGSQGAALSAARKLTAPLAAPASLGAVWLAGMRPTQVHAQAAAPAMSAARRESVRVLAEGAPNALDPHSEGFNRESLGTFTNVYDTLVGFQRNAVAPYVYHYDYAHLTGALAASFDILNGGRSLRFKLRRNARFHSGNPVTADAVKWSLDRAVSLPASKRQLATGSLTDPAQFVVEDTYTLRIDLPRPDRYALPNLALTYASIIDAKTVRAHASADDPWGTKWLNTHAAGGGAYRVAAWQSGQRIDYERYDAWVSGNNGKLPFVRRAIAQAVPEGANRLAALAKGDADIALQLAPNEFDAAGKMTGVHTFSIPLTNTFRFVAFNTQMKPFDDVRVRQAVAYAMPYEDLFTGVARGHGARLFGAVPGTTPSSAWPQAYCYVRSPEKARALLKEAGYPNGFSTTFTYNTSDAAIAEPAALLIQQALAEVGIHLTIEKAPGAQWGSLQTGKKMPFFIDWSSAWFNDPDYFYRVFFEGNWRWNFGSFQNAELVKLTDQARWSTDPAAYTDAMQRAATVVEAQLPILPLWLPSFDIAMRQDLRGFTYYIHGQVDFRTLYRA